MTVVGGLLWVADNGPAARPDGLALAPMVSAAGPSSLEAVLKTRADMARGRWDSIVIHHSGSAVGTPASIELEHRRMNLVGLGHHFVIGNGRGIADGELYVGYRWLDQLPGAHVAGEAGADLNQRSISICLVGNGERQAFTEAQLSRLAELVRLLSADLGIASERVFLHADLAPVADPGRYFPTAAFREQLAPGL